MENIMVRESAKKHGVRLWQVAEALGVSDFTLSRRLRHELPEAERAKLIAIVEQIADERKEGLTMGDVLTIRETVARAKSEGIRLTEYALRCWIKSGVLPVRLIGQSKKALVHYPTLLRFLACADGGDNAVPPAPEAGGIRPVEVRS